MLELDITDFFNSECPSDYSASRAEIGHNAAMGTFQASLEAAQGYDFIKGDIEAREAIQNHFKAYGSWEDDIESLPDIELNAVLIQDISASIREYLSDFGANTAYWWDWNEYQELAEQGSVSGRLFGGPTSTDGRIYFTLEE